MRLELSKTEMERLLEIAYLGAWVLNGHRPEEERAATHDAVLGKIYALAEEEGLGFLVERGADGEARPSPALEARIEMAGFLQDYDDCVFWDELAIRMAERDLRAEIGARLFDAMPPDERRKRVDALARTYDREFDRRGVERLRITDERRPARRSLGGGGTRDAITERLKKLFDDSGKP